MTAGPSQKGERRAGFELGLHFWMDLLKQKHSNWSREGSRDCSPVGWKPASEGEGDQQTMLTHPWGFCGGLNAINTPDPLSFLKCQLPAVTCGLRTLCTKLNHWRILNDTLWVPWWNLESSHSIEINHTLVWYIPCGHSLPASHFLNIKSTVTILWCSSKQYSA